MALYTLDTKMFGSVCYDAKSLVQETGSVSLSSHVALLVVVETRQDKTQGRKLVRIIRNSYCTINFAHIINCCLNLISNKEICYYYFKI